MYALLFLTQALFNLLALVFILRLFLYAARADFYNPLSQFVYRVTNPVVGPLRQVIPNLGMVELSTLLVIVAVQALGMTVSTMLQGALPAPGPLLIAAVLETVRSTLGFLVFALIVNAIMSWVPGMAGHPVSRLLGQVCEPVLRPIRGVLPPIGGLDLSPLVAILLLQAVLIQLNHMV
jgi:YggT family protein